VSASNKPFTVVVIDDDGWPHTFPVSAPDELSAELELALHEAENYGPVCAVLSGELEINPPGVSETEEDWTVVGLWEDEPFAWVTSARSSGDAEVDCQAHYEDDYGINALGNLPLVVAGSFRGRHSRVSPVPGLPGPRSRLSSLAGRQA
jgi:hypothetical protein